jgi:alpha-galactosidase
MLLDRKPQEVWLDLHYRYKGEIFRFNLPLPQGGKFLDGLRVDYERVNLPEGRRFTIEMEPLTEVEMLRFELTGHLVYGENIKSVFVNGYQSWTGSRERFPGEKISALNWPGRIFLLQKYGDYQLYSYPEKKGRFHGYSYAYTRYPNRLFFAGSLDESAGYSIIGTDLKHDLFSLSKDVAGLRLNDRRLILDFVLLEGSEDEVFDRYKELRNGDSGIPPGGRAAAWSSWHGAVGTIDEVSIRRNLAEFRERKIPLKYFIIGNGWESAPGDWESPSPGFPSGMSSLAAEIKGSGYVPGIWFSPFIVGRESSVFRNRKEWLAKDAGRRLKPAGWIPSIGGTFFALDLSLADVRDYIAESIRRIREEWDFGLIKMDLLYAAALYPPEGKSRGEAMSDAMNFLHSLKGGSEYLLSSVPLESAFGKAEYCRIGAQTTPFWEHRFTRNIHSRERFSTLNNLRSTVGRRQLNGRFFSNDTDIFHLSSGRKSMEAPRRYTQLLLHYLLGSLITTSDNLSDYDEDEMKTYLSQFPMIQPELEDVQESRRTVTVKYRAGGRSFISISNLAERIRPFELPEGKWFGAKGLRRRAHHVAGGRKQVLKPGESRNYMSLDNEYFAGSDGHLFPGCEIESVLCSGTDFTVKQKPAVRSSFRIWLRVPDELKNMDIRINGGTAEFLTTPYGDTLATGIISAAPDIGST